MIRRTYLLAGQVPIIERNKVIISPITPTEQKVGDIWIKTSRV